MGILQPDNALEYGYFPQAGGTGAWVKSRMIVCSLRWHDPDQVHGSQEYLPLSPSIRTPLVENSIDYGNGFVNSVSVVKWTFVDGRFYRPAGAAGDSRIAPTV